ncbi:MAG: LacI family DNA-binding transcriptional regulator [Pseudomonadota bacterium]
MVTSIGQDGQSDGSQRATTLLDLARAAGVSRTTASNAFNRPDQLSPKLRARVLEIADKMGYAGPNPMARMLRTGRAGSIGVVFGKSLTYGFTDPTSIAFLKGVASVCEKEGASLLILPETGEEEVGNAIQGAAVDGFIVYCMHYLTAVNDAVGARQLPSVAVSAPETVPMSTIDIDDRSAAREAAAHLVGLGHRRFGVLALDVLGDGYDGPLRIDKMTDLECTPSVDRYRGYRDALVAASLEDTELKTFEVSGNSEDHARKAAVKLLSQKPRPTAILAMSDRLAVGALLAATDLGLDVPGDLSVVGFDDIPLAKAVTPALTTVHQPLEEKGAAAARLVFHPPKGRPRHVVLPTELLVRNSTGLAPDAG